MKKNNKTNLWEDRRTEGQEDRSRRGLDNRTDGYFEIYSEADLLHKSKSEQACIYQNITKNLGR